MYHFVAKKKRQRSLKFCFSPMWYHHDHPDILISLPSNSSRSKSHDEINIVAAVFDHRNSVFNCLDNESFGVVVFHRPSSSSLISYM